MVSLNVAPTFGNTSNIPNEDSTDFEFDETNLFEPSRFPGLDRVDTGTKVAYGLRFSILARARPSSAAASARATRSGEFVHPAGFRRAGQSLGLCRRVLCAARSRWLDLSYRFRLGKSDLQFRRSDALASFGPAFLRFNLGYLNLSKEPQAFDDDDNS